MSTPQSPCKDCKDCSKLNSNRHFLFKKTNTPSLFKSCDCFQLNSQSSPVTPELPNSSLSSNIPLPETTKPTRTSTSLINELSVNNTTQEQDFTFISPRDTTCWKVSRPNTASVRKYENRKVIMEGNNVKYATLDGLIEYVLTEQCDEEMRDTFTYTFCCVSDQNIVLERLHDKYVENVNNKGLCDRITRIVEKWVNQMWNDFDSKTIRILQSFVSLYQLSGDLITSQKLQDGLQRKEFITTTVEETNRIGISLFNPILNFLLIDPLMIARQITLIEWEMFKLIKPPELYAWNKKEKEKNSPNIFNFVRHFNSMNDVFVRLLLNAPDVSNRVCIARHILEIGNGFITLNNFNGVMEVVSTFAKASIHRLRLTKRFFGEDGNRILNKIDEITQNNSNFKNLRECHKKAVGATLPYLGMFLTDMFFTEDMTSSAVSAFESVQNKTETVLINVDKCRTLSKVVKTIVQYQQTPYLIKRSKEIRDYLEGLIEEKPMDDDEEYKLSQLKESRELICKCTGVNLQKVFEIEHQMKYKVIQMIDENNQNLKLNPREVILWVLLPAEEDSYNYPIRISVSLDTKIEEVVKELRNENYEFVLAPTKLLQVGASLSNKNTVEEVLIQTKDYRNDPKDFFAVFSKNDAISLLFICKKGSPQFMLKYKTNLDPTNPLAHAIPSLVHLFRTKNDEFAFLQIDNKCKPLGWINPFAKASICCDLSKLIVIPVEYLALPKNKLLKRCTPHPLNDTHIHLLSCTGFNSKQFESKSSFTTYKIIYSDGFIFLYKEKKKPSIILNLGYYQLRLAFNPKTHIPSILLTKAIQVTNLAKEVPTYVLVGDSTEDTMKWYQSFCSDCLSNNKKRILGMDVEKVSSGLYEKLIDSLYLSPKLTCNQELFDMDLMSRMEIINDYAQNQNVYSFSIVELSQILIVILGLIPTPLISEPSLELLRVGIVEFASPRKSRIGIGIARVMMKWSDGRIKMLEKVNKTLAKTYFGNDSMTNEINELLPKIALKEMPEDVIEEFSLRETQKISILIEENQKLLQETVSEILVELSGIRTIEEGQIGSKQKRTKYMKGMDKDFCRQTMNLDKSGIPANMIKVIFKSEEGDDVEDPIVEIESSVSMPIPQIGFDNVFLDNFQTNSSLNSIDFGSFKNSLELLKIHSPPTRSNIDSISIVRTKDIDNCELTTLKKLLIQRSRPLILP